VGGRDPEVTRVRRKQAERARGMTAIYAVMISISLLIAIQFLLLMVSVEGFMGGRGGVLVPAALGSGLCFAGSCWLIGYIARPRGAAEIGLKDRRG
jgi:hypothetical protein